MTKARSLAIPIVCILAGGSLFAAEDFSNYRGLQFGMSVAAAAKQVGTKPNEVRFVHKRPAVIQEMDWQPRPPVLPSLAKSDPVKEALLYFFNGALFRIVVTYDRYKIAGMSAEDMIDAISLTYGTPSRPTAEIAYHSFYGEVTPVLARWEDPDHSYNLVRTGDQSSFALVLYSKGPDALAQAAIVEAVRLDVQEAPQREIEKQNKREEEERLVLDKARSVNRPNFRP